MNLSFLNRPVGEYNEMTPIDAIEELESWDFIDIFGSDGIRLSDAIKRLNLLIEEINPKVDTKTGLVIINEKLNILADIKYLENNQLKEIHFYDSLGREFYANLGDYENCQEEMAEEVEKIKNITKGSDLYLFIKEYGNDNETIFKFGNQLYISI